MEHPIEGQIAGQSRDRDIGDTLRGATIAVAGRVLRHIGGHGDVDIATGSGADGGGVTGAAAAKRGDRPAADADIAACKAADTFRETDAQGKGRAAVVAVWGIDGHPGGRGIRGHVDHGLPRGRGVAVAGQIPGDIGGHFEGDSAGWGVRSNGGGVARR